MKEVSRFGVSLPTELLETFDELNSQAGYTNRSKAIADLIREKLVERTRESEKGEVIGIVTFTYDHHTSDVVEKLLDIQHSVKAGMYSSMHIHLDHDNCLEIVALKGEAKNVREFADSIRTVRGVKHTGLVITSNVK